jgi:uncharacterized protein involved in exopolysaccharide biosynthesis
MESEKYKKSLEISDFWAIVWKRKWLIGAPLVLVFLISFVGSYLITPEYQSSVIIWLGNPVQLSDQLRRIIGDAGNVLGDDRHRAEELRSLQNEVTSSPYIKQLVDKLKLDQDPSLDKKVQKIRASRPDLSPQQVKFDLIVDDLRDRIAVSYAGYEQVRISVLSANPFRASEMAQTLGEILMAEKMRQEQGSVRLSQDFSYEQLEKYENDLQAKIAEKTEFERKYLGFQFNELVVSDSNRKAILGEIEGTNTDIEESKREEGEILAKLINVPATKLSIEESSKLKKLKTDTQNLLTSIANLMSRYRWSDPEILNFKTRLYNLYGEIEKENRKLVDEQFSEYDDPTRENLVQLFNIRTNLDILYSKSNNLKLALADLNEKINSAPQYQARLDQLTREINAARDLRDRFKEQLESSQISQAFLRESRFRVVEPAKVPLEPIKPDRPKIIIVGAILGLMIGAGAALLAELLDNSLKSVEDVEACLGYRVIGVIPEIAALRNYKSK